MSQHPSAVLVLCLVGAWFAGVDGVAAQAPFTGPHGPAQPDGFAGSLVGDANGDALPDLLDRHSGAPLLLRLGRGDGGFEPAVPVAGTTAADTRNSFVDITGDGLDDLVLSGNYAELRFRHALPGGGFTSGGTLALPDVPRGVLVADVTGDGIRDLVVALPVDFSTFDLLTFVGMGGGAFGPAIDAGTTLGFFLGGVSFHTGDLDGDGHTDLVHNGDSDGFVVVRGFGDGTFAPHVSVGGERQSGIVVGDFNGDGVDDVIIRRVDVLLGDDPMLLRYLGVPAGLPGPAEWLTAENAPRLAAGDVNADGRLDLVAGGPGLRLDIWLQQPDGSLGPPRSAPLPLDTNDQLLLADLDHDGHLDILVQPFGSAEVVGSTLAFGDGEGGFGPSYGDEPGVWTAATKQPGATHVVDIDGDGLLDLLTQVATTAELRMRAGRLGREFGPQVLATVGGPAHQSDFALGDFDGDGLPDLLVGVSVGGGPDRLEVQLGHGDFTFAEAVATSVDQLREPLIADLTGDGLDDVLAYEDDTTSRVYTSLGDGSFAVGPRVTLPGGFLETWALGALDGDALPDLVAATVGPDELRTYVGGLLPGVTLPAASSVSLPGFPRVLRLGDVNADGHTDAVLLIGLSTGPRLLHTLLGDGDGGWSAAITSDPLPYDDGVGGLALADLDGDGLLDAVLTGEDPSLGSWELTGLAAVWPGDGSGAFTPGPVVPLADDVNDAVLADVNEDGALDLVATQNTGRRVTVLFGDGPWTDLLGGLKGEQGVPSLVGHGTLRAGEPVTLVLSNARPSGFASLVLGFSLINANFKGGTWAPALDLLVEHFPLSADGELVVSVEWPEGVPAGFPIYLQAWGADPASPRGFAGSNTLGGVVPER